MSMRGVLLLVAFISIGFSITPTKNTIFYDTNNLEYFVFSVDSPSGCVPEAKNNGREVTCTLTGYTPTDYKNMNAISTYFNVNNCFYVPPGNSNGYWYRDSYCGLNPLDNTYFYSNCYDPATWRLQKYSDNQCTQLLETEFIPQSGGCYNVPDKNESKILTCGQNSYEPSTTTSPPPTYSWYYYNYTTNPSVASIVQYASSFALLVSCIVFL